MMTKIISLLLLTGLMSVFHISQASDIWDVPVPERKEQRVINTLALTDVNSHRFYMGVEGGVSYNTLHNRILLNWFEGYRWQNERHVRSNVLKMTIGYMMNPNVSLEMAMWSGSKLRRQHNVDPNTTYIYNENNYDTALRATGFDVMIRYLSTEKLPGFFVRGGYSMIEIDGTSFMPKENRFSTSTRVSHGMNSALHLALGVGYQYTLTEHVDVLVSATHYENIFSNERNKINQFMMGAKYNF